MPYTVRLLVCLFLGLSVLLPSQAFSQEMPVKTGEKPHVHSVGKAAAFSAMLPGLGQAYNKKYWKIPIIYAGFGAIGYFVYRNNKDYKQFREAYIYVANGDTYPINNPYVDKYDQTQLKDAMDFYRRNRDLSIIIGGLWYTLNILEAYVDAHFFYYDISDDLSMHVAPATLASPFNPMQPAPGIKMSLNF